MQSDQIPTLAAVLQTIKSGDQDSTYDIIDRVLVSSNDASKVDTLNKLLVTSGHHRHQEVAFELQQLGLDSTIPYVKQALDMGFDHLEYTASEDGTIAKWYSHLLSSIGSKSAIELIREYSDSTNNEVAKEMLYRLKRIT